MASVKKQDHEDLDFQIVFYEAVLRKRPIYVEALIALGEVYTKKGFYEKGLEVDRKLSELRPENPIVHYNLACSLSLLGDVTSSFRAIKHAISLGYSDLQYLTQDPDLSNLRKDERFTRFLRRLRKTSTGQKNGVKKTR